VSLLDYRIRQRDYLISIARALVSRLNVRAVLRLILQASVDMLQGHAGLIALQTQESLGEAEGFDKRQFTFGASYGLPPGLLQAFKPLVEDVPEFTTSADFSIPNLAEKLKQIAQETGLLLRQVVALPMTLPIPPDGTRPREQELLGLILIFRSQSVRFSTDERQILSNFADYAAIAVHNARLYETAVTERRRLDALLESSADGIMVLKSDLTIERINRALVTLTGWPAEEAVGKPYDEIIVWAKHDSNGRRVTAVKSERTLSQAVEEGWPFNESRPLYVEGELRRRNGSVVSVGITYAPLLPRTGKFLPGGRAPQSYGHIIATVRDITRFREADTLKNIFISVVSHELKTPVSIIKGYAETLLRPEARRNPALVEEMLTAITDEADRLTRLMDDLLDASQLQAGGIPFNEAEDVDLKAIARHVMDRYTHQTSQHQLTMEFPDDFPTIKGDPQRLEQALDNLISNAIKYSPNGGKVTLQADVKPAEIVIKVSDEGIGIPMDEQERIFERFYRVESPETRAVPGTGLGLYLTRAIIQAHGGRCWVESTPNEGSAFYMVLPLETGLVLWEGEPTEMKTLNSNQLMTNKK
jgi:PAS domain S-box-containing protein